MCHPAYPAYSYKRLSVHASRHYLPKKVVVPGSKNFLDPVWILLLYNVHHLVIDRVFF